MGAPFDKSPTKSDSALVDNHLRENAKSSIQEEELHLDDNAASQQRAPDGGWGYMVAVGMIVVFITSVGPAPSFTIIYGDFLESTGQAGTAITILNSLFNISFSCAGLMTNALIKKYSIRSVGVVGAILYSVPYCLAALVRYFYELALSFFVQGVGLGLMFTICNTNFNAFFVKKRSKIMGVCQAVIGVGWIVYPIFIEQMMKIYGFRGTAAINGALSLNCIVGMTMMHPVEWYINLRRKKSQLDEDDKDIKLPELQDLIAKSKRRSTIDYIHSSKNSSRWNSLRSLKDADKDVPLTFQVSKARVQSASDVEKALTHRKKKSNHSGYESPVNVIALTLSSSSIANSRTAIGIDSLSKESLDREFEKRKSGINDKNEATTHGTRKKRWTNFIDWSVLKKKGFLSSCCGMSMVFVSDWTFASLLPLMMAKQGYTQSDAALAITVGAMTELVSRIILAVVMSFVEMRPKKIFFTAMVSLCLVKFGYLYFENTLTGALLMVGAIGIVRSWMCIQPLVVVEGIDKVDQYASAHGLFAIISGIISTVFGPLVGLVKDWSDSYTVCQWFLIILNAIFVIPWLIDLISERIAQKTQTPK